MLLTSNDGWLTETLAYLPCRNILSIDGIISVLKLELGYVN